MTISIVLNGLALVGFLLAAGIIIALFSLRKRGGPHRRRWQYGLAVCLMALVLYEVWFYLPRTQLLPADQYGPVSEVQVTQPDMDVAVLSEDASGQILALCNELRGSRSACGTLFDPQASIGAGAYVYFSNQGENRADTWVGCAESGEKILLKIRGQVYSVWRDHRLYDEICEILAP